MFLKSLEIVGFKSFAERVSIDFVKGVTAVVGPNGSGKSNITDAIRWVLGEQSIKSLRGGKMEDIIFAGSDSRKPLNFAEVSITLDNEDHFLPIDYNEVNITRRVYRTGESEFFINKQECRLKDITDLLLDSGLGKEAFSIISQGKVEEILNSKPEDRRTIFEEAAGVLKYKTRKKKAEHKLFETEENLNRVRDILNELDGQLEPLKMQASIAKDYLEKKEELKQYEVALLVYEIEQNYEKWQALKENLSQHKDNELKLSAELQKLEAETISLRDQIVALDDSVNQLQNILLVTSEDLEKLEGRKEVLKERKKNAIQNKAQLEKLIEDGKLKRTTLEEELHSITKEKEKVGLALDELKKSLAIKQSELELYAEDIEEKIETLKSDFIEKLNEKAAINNDNQHIYSQLATMKHKRERKWKENEQFLSDRKSLVVKKSDLEKNLVQTQEKMDSLIQKYREINQKIENNENQYHKQEKNYYQALQFIQQAKSRKELLEEMEEDYSGFFQGVKEVLKARDQLKGICGAVAELIQVEKQYEVAIDIALSSSMQHIVVETEEDAKKAIQFLKQNHYGRATFLPLSIIKPKMVSVQDERIIKDHPSFIGTAASLIKFDSKYQSVIQNLLGNVLISHNIDGANKLAKLLNYRYRIVTLEGDVVNPGGSMTGGTIKQKTTSLLSRKTELESLNQKLKSMEEKSLLLENDLKQKKELINNLRQEANLIRQTGESLRIESDKLKEQLNDIKWQESSLNDRLSIFDTEEKEYEMEKNALEAKKQENDYKLASLLETISEIEKEIQQLSEKRNTHQTAKAVLIEEINELKILAAKKEEQFNNLVSQIQDMKLRLDEVTLQLNENENDLNLLISETENSHSGVELIEQEVKQKLADKNNVMELIATRRQDRLNAQQKLEDLENEAKELRRQHKGLSELLVDEEVQLNRIDVDLENRLNVLREEYFLTFEGAKEEYPLPCVYEEAKKKVKLIKLAIDELGTVNLGAIDEYERINERYQFLTEQKNDLTDAKDTLFKVIEEMDEEMVKRFDESFTAIKEQFNSVFQSLFGGGKAELKLTNPEDLLNTGVDIIAQPPGKKLQNLALLSGGERALTAIALLFSILRVRPVPFTVLDEVEAALDDANVYRFSQYLRQFSQETQFIVITHRKGTMEEADVLYGVTMQESGVSKMVSVRLEDVVEAV